MSWTIEIHYETGSSFHNEDVVSDIGWVWEDLDVVKENLRRIKIHYEYYAYKNSWGMPDKEVEKPDCWVDNEYNGPGLELLKDDGSPHVLTFPFWCGHFETLYSAEIVAYQNETMRVTF